MTTRSSAALYRASEIIREEEDRHRAWLHDNVLQVLEYVATGGFGSCDDPVRLMEVAARAADDLRHVIDGASCELHPCDLRDALRDAVDEARELAGFEVHLDLTDMVAPVDADIAEEVAGVVREALTNARKHAHPATVHVQAISDENGLEVRVVDDGDGFDPLSVREGVGIRYSMRQRMARCGGSVAIASAPGRGAVVRILVGEPATAAATTITESVA